MTPAKEADVRAAYEASLRYLPDRTWESYLADRIAPAGKRWRCGACGKTSTDRYDGPGGWDEACMLNSFLEDA